MKLRREHALPQGLLEARPWELADLLGGPTLIHLPGRRDPALFVSILLHGNEPIGLGALQLLLHRYEQGPLPRALSIFVGNVAAARVDLRRLDHQPDYNRIWPGADSSGLPEHALMAEVWEEMARRGVFASVDIHNNTGTNPLYACVNALAPEFLHLALMFSRTVVYFQRPTGVQSAAFARLCPSVALECGKAGLPENNARVADYLDACLHLAEHPRHPVVPQDISLFHTACSVKVVEEITFAFAPDEADLVFDPRLDHMNFRELPVGTRLGVSRGSRMPVRARDDQGVDVTEQFFELSQGVLRTRRALMPAMLTLDLNAIRLDCLCYVMERLSAPASAT